MCGVNLILNFPEVPSTAIQQMMAATRHRGPDHEGWLKLGKGVFLAGNRLKTVDLSDWSNQPVTIDRDYFLVWNGAIYNADELRNQLLSEDESFESRSDTEVLGRWMKNKGVKGLESLQGMFALAFVDAVKDQIIIARDRFGKKPLYFFHQEQQWVFSSEAKAILQSGLVNSRLDGEQFLPYFYTRSSFPDVSFFRGVRQVMPGQVMTLDWHGQVLKEDYIYHCQRKIKQPDKGLLKDMLTDAVLRHFQADVPVGMLLSGGADSGLLLHTWIKETGIPLHTFTATFEEQYLKEFQDPIYAAGLSKKYNCTHHEILVTPGIVLENWEEYILGLDQPIGDSASFISWIIAKEAKKYVKILISGAGADELFGGYNRHDAFRFFLKNRNAIRKWRNLGSKLPFVGRNLRKFFRAIEESDETTFLNFSSLRNVPKAHQNKFLDYYPKECGPYKSALSWDRDYYLVNDVLKIHDNSLMAHGVEGRAPYLDKAIVELSTSMTERQHLALSSKQWIRELLEDAGLKEQAKRKKMGFGLPLKSWLSKEEAFRTFVFNALKSFDKEFGNHFPSEMRTLVQAPEKYVKEDFLQIWNMFVLASWCEKNQK